MDYHYTSEQIMDSDLCNTKYSIDVLTKYFHSLNTNVVLKTQKLTAQFCVKYILDSPIEPGNKYSDYYNKTYILNCQKHISEEEFDKAYYLENSYKNKTTILISI